MHTELAAVYLFEENGVAPEGWSVFVGVYMVDVAHDASLVGIDVEFTPRVFDVVADVDGNDAGASIYADTAHEFDNVAANDADKDSIDEGFHVVIEFLGVAVVEEDEVAVLAEPFKDAEDGDVG